MTDADKYTVISEGKASILFPKENQVFYNPVQQFNRDLSVTCIRAWSEIWAEEKAKKNKKRKREEENATEEPGKPHIPDFNILEALSASGLRAIRYAKEIPGVKNIIANDFSKDAVASIERNVIHNKVEDLVTPNESDANLVMYGKQFHVIDLDPYGSATPFIDAAVRSIDENGLLLVTCTDLAVLAGNSHPEKCFSSYGGQTFHGGDATHESALRLVLHMIAGTAAKYGKCIEPQLSLSIDFYVRLFIRVKTSPIKVKELASNTMVTYHCTETGQWKNQYFGRKVQRDKGPKFTYNTMDRSLPDFSDPELHYYINGPMWGGPLHNKAFIDKALEVHSTLDPEVYGTLKRIKGMLTVAQNEILEPFYFSPARMCQLTKCPNFKQAELASAIMNAGYEVSMSHASHECLKTNAPFDVIIDIYKYHLKKQGHELSKNLKPWGRKLMETPIKGEYDFTIHPKVQEMDKIKKSKTLVRYQENPTKNWGPKARAQGTHVYLTNTHSLKMPIELLLSPIMRPLVLAKAVLFHPHRETSRYVPNIIDVGPVSTRNNPTSVKSYTVRREFGQGAKVYGVFDDANPIKHIDQRLYWFVRSRAVKGAYKMYTTGEAQATAHIRAGLRSNILMIQSTSDDDEFELGWHVMGHRVDAIDSYRLFELKDGFTYQWTTKGKFMEKVHNLGEKESEVRERVASVTVLPGHGFQIQIDESKVSREMALTTAMISFIDQWNTQLGVGGIYYPYQPSQVRWKRD